MRRRTVFAIVLLCGVTYAVGGAGADGGGNGGAARGGVDGAAKAGAKQFCAKMVMTEMRHGKMVKWAEPTLVAIDGQKASFLAGGEVPVDPGKTEYVEFGTRADVTVYEIGPDQLRVSAWLNVSTMDTPTPESIVIPESGVRLIRTIKPGESLEADLPGGRHVKMTIARVTP